MVDKFIDEITSALASADRLKGGATPAILIGVGDFGADCLRRINANFESRPETSLSLVIEERRDDKPGSAFLFDGQIHKFILPKQPDNRAAVFGALRTYGKELGGWLSDEAADLTRRATGRRRRKKIAVFVIARAEDTAGSGLTAGLPLIFKEYLDRSIANWAVVQFAFILVPRGRSRTGHNVFALLDDLEQRKTIYESVFLFSEAGAGNVMDEQGSIDTVGEFAGLMLEPDFGVAVDEILDVSGARFASFGVASIVHPVKDIVFQEYRRFAKELISDGLLAARDEPHYRLADEYVKQEDLNIDRLYGQLTAGREGNVFEQVSQGSLDLHRAARSAWPDRINAHEDYLREKKLPNLIKKLERNLMAIGEESKCSLSSRLDELMSESSALDKAAGFIDRLETRVEELKVQAGSREKEAQGREPDTAARKEQLVSRIQGMPGLAAIISRGFVVAMLMYFFALRFVDVLHNLPNRYLDERYLPADQPSAVAAAALTALFFWLLYRRDEQAVTRAKDGYLAAIATKCRIDLDARVYRLLGRWLGGPAPPSFLSRIESEREALVNVNKSYLKIGDQLAADGEPALESRARQSVFAAFGREDVDLRYKKARYDLGAESEQFAMYGHQNWRELRLTELRQRLEEYCLRGLTFIDQRSIDKLLLDLAPNREAMGHFLDDMRRHSQPMASLAAQAPPSAEIIGVAGGVQSPLIGRSDGLVRAAVVPINSTHRLALVQLACPIAIENLAAFPDWRRDFELYRDKADLICVPAEI